MAEPQSINQVNDSQKYWASRVLGSGEQFELPHVQSRVDAVEKMSVTCDSLSDAGIDVDAAKVVFGAKALSLDQAGGTPKSWEQHGSGSDKPTELSHAQGGADPASQIYMAECCSSSDADVDVDAVKVVFGAKALSRDQAGDMPNSW